MLRLTDAASAPLDDLPEEALASYLELCLARDPDAPLCRLHRGADAVTLAPLDQSSLRGDVEACLAGAAPSEDGAVGADVLAVAPGFPVGTLSVPLPAARSAVPGPETPAQIGLIDAGIAFWNPNILNVEIRSVGHLAPAQAGGVERLASSEIDAAIARGTAPEGDRANRRMLAAAFPGSVHAPQAGRPPLVRPGQVAHGTAMLDAIARTAPPRSRLHALELPRAVLRDSTGIRMRAVLPLALAAMADMAARATQPNMPLRLVVLLSYGFPGGPQTGADPAFLRAVTAVLDALAARNILLELILPTGNHLQGQSVAHLPDPEGGARPPLTWRILPGDHSNNRLELFHAPGRPALTLTAPDGTEVTRAEGRSFALLRDDDRIVGLIYTRRASDSLERTEVILSGRGPDGAGPGAPFGAWRVALGGPGPARAYVRRDDSGFEDDRAAPFRRSWLEDPAYRPRDAMGLPGTDDSSHADSLVRRAGTISVLCTGRDPRLRSVGAHWSGGDGTHPAVYGGLEADSADAPVARLAVDGPGPFMGMPLRGDGSDRLFRLRGTSIAAALHAGERAAPQAPTSASA
ncbi:hypothetical protein [Jannaschia seohaensis]|uniref:Peptidase S8/S53 domain-containing protein n=1 Tax=Jannaschia seohaensis TaxID=475081 RepID=A0A2Y9C3L0_9RHOB|nr:hypothetical protein [Jannaschia seohaensis]PWJ21735.1 hypothetical protein BCF38_101143 [Jannaschia seohaensis]SSA38013.1 hypothetical protein SAMN05421539_101143 [Jannaschia seohaensis]